MTIKILNNVDELNLFPSSQSIFLWSDTLLEDTMFIDNIVLFRLQTENQLINLSEPYSYNLGYLRETFDRIPLVFKTEESDGGYKITCTPSKLLNLDSKFLLYISSNLSQKVVNVQKLNSKSSSNISVKLKDNFNVQSSSSLKIEDTSYLVGGKNIVKVNFNGAIQTIDTRTKKVLLSNNVEITLEDTIYVKGEEFIISIDPHASATEDVQCIINTVNSQSIKAIEKDQASTKISNLDILNFYNSVSSTKAKVIEKSIPKYLDHNVFSVKIPEGYRIDISNPEFKNQINIAFNNYMLNSLNLYDKNIKYVVTVVIDDFENEIVFIVEYSDDDNQASKVVFDTSALEPEVGIW